MSEFHVEHTAHVARSLSAVQADRIYSYVHHTVIDGQYDVVLRRSGTKGPFMVQYGLQITYGLTYEDACAEYGACIMHALACAGRL